MRPLLFLCILQGQSGLAFWRETRFSDAFWALRFKSQTANFTDKILEKSSKMDLTKRLFTEYNNLRSFKENVLRNANLCR